MDIEIRKHIDNNAPKILKINVKITIKYKNSYHMSFQELNM